MPSANPLAQAVTAGPPSAATQDGSAIAGTPLAPSSDTDGSGTVTGTLTGNVGTGVFFNGSFGGGLSGTFNGKSFPLSSSFSGSASLSDGTTFTSISGQTTFKSNGSSFTGTFQGFGNGSDGDSMVESGTMSGTIDGSGNITSGSFTGTVSVGDAVYTWNPQGGSMTANLSQNWELNGVQQAAGTLLPGTAATDTVLFDGNVSNAPINWNKNFRFSTMLLGPASGGAAYTGLQSIAGGVTIELTGVNGASLNTNQTGSKLNLDFGDTLSVFQIDAAATITNMTLAGNPAGNFVINGGTTTIAGAGGYKDTIGVNFIVGTNATLNDQSNNALVFSNNNVPIQVQGTMLVFYGTGAGATLLDGTGFTNDYVDVYGGTLSYSGNQGVKDTFQNVSVIVEHGGTFKLGSAVGKQNGARLIVTGAATQTNNVSMYMTGSSQLLLYDAAILECDKDYSQDGGELATTDTTICTLQDGNLGQGTANITGGSVAIALGTGSVGTLVVNCGTLNFAGTYYADVVGDSNGTCDLLQVNGDINISNTTSSLIAGYYGTLEGGNSWVILTANNQLTNKFAINNDDQTGLHETLNKPADGDYQLSF